MITSPDNDKLKLIRKLRSRRWRRREGLFATEGEDLLASGLRAGVVPELVLVAAGSGLDGEEVEPGLLDAASGLGSGTRAIAVWPAWREGGEADRLPEPVAYLHAIGDPANVGTILRTAAALGGSVLLGHGCADPHGPKAVRASMGAIFSAPVGHGGLERSPRPRAALLAHGGGPESSLDGAATVVLGSEREGVPADVLAGCERTATIAVRPEAVESLNVAAAAAIALHRISSAAASDRAGKVS